MRIIEHIGILSEIFGPPPPILVIHYFVSSTFHCSDSVTKFRNLHRPCVNPPEDGLQQYLYPEEAINFDKNVLFLKIITTLMLH